MVVLNKCNYKTKGLIKNKHNINATVSQHVNDFCRVEKIN